MPAEALPRSRAGLPALTLDSAAVLMFAALSAAYFVQAMTLAEHAPFWMDEILSLWTARQPGPAAIWSALKRGAEFTPPLYDWLLHVMGHAGITGALGARMPSILAIYVAALATGALVHHRAGLALAALAAGVVLSSGLFGYAVQARPYALVTAAFALALMLYDRDSKPSSRRLAAIGLLLATAIGLHFYALLLAGGLGLLELIRARVERRAPDWRLLATIALAGCTILLWLPILIAARAHSGADVWAPDYYGAPVALALVRTYYVLLGWLIAPLIALLIAGVLLKREASPLRTTALVITAAPVGVFLFALIVSHSYADRYALAGGIGIALLFAALAQQLGQRAAPVSVLILALLIVGTAWRDYGTLGKADRHDALATFAAAPAALPIVTGSGLRYFEIRENQPGGKRLIFLDTPGVRWSDPTNRNQVLRWKAIDPRVGVRDAQAFLCATPAFLLFAQPPDGGADALPEWLAGRADFTPPPAGRASLTLVRSRPCVSRPVEPE